MVILISPERKLNYWQRAGGNKIIRESFT